MRTVLVAVVLTVVVWNPGILHRWHHGQHVTAPTAGVYGTMGQGCRVNCGTYGTMGQR